MRAGRAPPAGRLTANALDSILKPLFWLSCSSFAHHQLYFNVSINALWLHVKVVQILYITMPLCQSSIPSVGYKMHTLIFSPHGFKQSKHNWNQVANLEIWQIKVRTRCVVRRHRFDLILSLSLCFSLYLSSLFLPPRSLIHSQVGTWMQRIVNSQNDICDHGALWKYRRSSAWLPVNMIPKHILHM